MFYEQYFRILGPDPAKIVSAASKPHGLTVSNYYLAINPSPSIGFVDAPLPAAARSQLQPVNGTTIPPDTASWVITEVEYSGTPQTATDAGLVLSYRIGQNVYRATFPNKFEIGSC